MTMTEQKDMFSEVIDLDKDEFIDAENDRMFSSKDSYETILVTQIQKCVNVLTMDKKSCYDKVKTKGGYDMMIVKDLDELIIRNVDVLRILMNKMLNRNPDLKKQIDDIIIADKKFEQEYNNRDIVYQGVGKTKIGALLLNSEHPLKKSLMTYHSRNYRDIFELLMIVYNKAKQQEYEDEID